MLYDLINMSDKYTFRAEPDFVLFDVRIRNFWLRRHDVVEVGKSLGLDIVPLIGTGTLHEAVDMARAGFRSAWGAFDAEGIVARPVVELLDRDGHRIIAKIKHRDFV